MESTPQYTPQSIVAACWLQDYTPIHAVEQSCTEEDREKETVEIDQDCAGAISVGTRGRDSDGA